MSELYQSRLINEADLRDLPFHPHMRGSSSRPWVDSLVAIQFSKSADVRVRTLDTFRRYSLTEVGKGRHTKHTGVTLHYVFPLPFHTCTNYVISIHSAYTVIVDLYTCIAPVSVPVIRMLVQAQNGGTVWSHEPGFCDAVVRILATQ